MGGSDESGTSLDFDSAATAPEAGAECFEDEDPAVPQPAKSSQNVKGVAVDDVPQLSAGCFEEEDLVVPQPVEFSQEFEGAVDDVPQLSAGCMEDKDSAVSLPQLVE